MDPTANEGVSAFSGLKYFRALMEGSIARSAMLELFDINIEAAEPGLVVLTAIPTAEHYNPLGFVHGGYAAVLLDTCMAAAIVTSLEPGLSPVTLEYKINFTRPMSAGSAPRSIRSSASICSPCWRLKCHAQWRRPYRWRCCAGPSKQ